MTINLSLRKILSNRLFPYIRLFKYQSLIVLVIKLIEKTIIKELGLFIDGSVQKFSFCPPKTSKPNQHTTWNTSHLHGKAWTSGKLEYKKLFAVFYDIKVMNAKVFAKWFEK